MGDKAIKQEAIVAIIQQHNTFLLVRRSDKVESAPGYWCPVGGKVESGESQADAVCREVMEEVGLSVRANQLVAQIPSSDNVFNLNFWTTTLLSGEAQIASDEVAELRWVTLNEMESLHPIFESNVQIFKKFAVS